MRRTGDYALVKFKEVPLWKETEGLISERVSKFGHNKLTLHRVEDPPVPITNNGLRKKIDKNYYTNAMEMKMERSEEKDAKYTVSDTEI